MNGGRQLEPRRDAETLGRGDAGAGNPEPTWQTVQRRAAALGVDCTSFVDPTITPPPDQPATPRGRPRKDAGGEPAPKKDADLAKPVYRARPRQVDVVGPRGVRRSIVHPQRERPCGARPDLQGEIERDPARQRRLPPTRS